MKQNYTLILMNCLFLMSYAYQPNCENPGPHLRSEHRHLWMGVNNPVIPVGVAEEDLDKLFVVCGNDTVYNPYGHSSMSVRGKGEGMQTVALHKMRENGQYELLREKTFKTRHFPDPTPSIGGRFFAGSKEMRTGEIQAQRGILCAVLNWDYSMTNRMQGFNILGRTAEGKDTLYYSRGGTFTDEQKAYIRTLEPGQHLIIKDVRVLMPGDKKPRTLNSLIYKIVE